MLGEVNCSNYASISLTLDPRHKPKVSNAMLPDSKRSNRLQAYALLRGDIRVDQHFAEPF